MNQDFYDTVRQMRIDLDLTQAEVERTAHLRAGFMSYLETGRMKHLPYLGVFHRFCAALETTPMELLEIAGHLAFEEADRDRLNAAIEDLGDGMWLAAA